MPKSDRRRIDYTPGPAALDSMEVARRLFPHLGTQEIIDRLVITGLYALKHPPWVPPPLWGNDRDTWALPLDLKGRAGTDRDC